MEYLVKKAAELVAGLKNVESMNINFSMPYKHDGYTRDSLVIHFKDDENGEERKSKMYLFSVTRQQWEFYM